MKVYPTKDVRNVVLLGCGGSGKTSLAEALFYDSGVSARLGKVEEGNTVSDFTPEEIRRRNSLYLTLSFIEHKDKKINLIDVPGYADFAGEIYAAREVCEGTIFVLDAAIGVEASSEMFWEEMVSKGGARAIFINRLDKEEIKFWNLIEAIKKEMTPQAQLFYFPYGEGLNLSGIVDILNQKLLKFSDKGSQVTEIPPEIEEVAKKEYEKLVESIASEDEELVEKYLEGKEIEPDRLKTTLRKAIAEGKIVPLFCGSATKNIGPQVILDFVVDYFPEPFRVNFQGEPQVPGKNSLSALVFKTFLEPHTGKLSCIKVYSGTMSAGVDVYNPNRRVRERIGQLCVLQGKKRLEVPSISTGDLGCVVKLKETSTNDTLCIEKEAVTIKPIVFPEPVMDLAIYPKTQGEEEKVANALATVVQEDQTIKWHYNPEIKESVVYGMGAVQLEAMVERLKERYSIEVELRRPHVPYKETIKAKTEVQGKYKRQSGGRGQYGDCWLRLEPQGHGKGYEFVDAIREGKIPKNYIPAVEKGVKQAMEEGVIAGYPLIDLKVTLYDGSYHEVDSSDIAFKIAGGMALRKGVEQAQATILEPIVNAEIIIPEEYFGAVVGDLNSRRGRILGMEPQGKKQAVKVQVPLAEMYKYAADLRSLTKGSGKFRLVFSHYEEAPQMTIQRLIEEYQKSRSEKK